MHPDPQAIDELVRRIVEAVHPRRVILFGSAARGEMGPNSDLDILVIMPDGTHRRRTAQEIYRRMWGFGFANRLFPADHCVLFHYGSTFGHRAEPPSSHATSITLPCPVANPQQILSLAGCARICRCRAHSDGVD